MKDDSGLSSRPVSVLLTGDVDYSAHHLPQDKEAAFAKLVEAGRELAGQLTFFFVAREAQQLPAQPGALKSAGHEIGCHGLTHGNEEEYDTMPADLQRRYLDEATDILARLSGAAVTAFRGPRVKISGPTLLRLSALGYVADSTVCSQRFDLVSSNLLQPGWLRAPRLPYHPSATDAYASGNLPILEVPVSALAIPFISSTLYVLGLAAMKLLFRLLYLEARRTGKPIVYLFHPYEFAPEIAGAKDYSANLKVHGLRFRRYLYRGDPATKLAWNLDLWRFMAGFPGVRFITVSRYVELTAAERRQD
jgi:hypothetical protein